MLKLTNELFCVFVHDFFDKIFQIAVKKFCCQCSCFWFKKITKTNNKKT
jgi:hypothetical protein